LNIMKQLRRGGLQNIVWLCALILAVAAVLTAPLAVSKYVTAGQGLAKARIAAWDVDFDPASLTNTGKRAVFLDSDYATAGDKFNTVEFVIDLNSEVTTDIIVKAVYTYPGDADEMEYPPGSGAYVPLALSPLRYDLADGVESPIASIAADTGVKVNDYTFRFPPGQQTVTFTITLQNAHKNQLTLDNYIREYGVFFTAVQVD